MHPANRVALWLWLVSFLPWLERLPLFVISLLVLVLAFWLARARLRRSLPRLRWLLLTMFAIYAWMTPGMYLWSGWLAPTREGLWLGFEQVLRIVGVIASLQILLSSMSRADLLAGLYALARPLDWLRLSRRRVAIRLALTIEMTESLLEKKISPRHLLDELENTDAENARSVLLVTWRWTWVQRAVLLFVLVMMLVSFWLGRHGAWL